MGGAKKKKPNPVGVKKGNVQNFKMGRKSGILTSIAGEGGSEGPASVFEGEDEDDEDMDVVEVMEGGEGSGTAIGMMRKEVLTCECEIWIQRRMNHEEYR